MLPRLRRAAVALRDVAQAPVDLHGRIVTPVCAECRHFAARKRLRDAVGSGRCVFRIPQPARFAGPQFHQIGPVLSGPAILRRGSGRVGLCLRGRMNLAQLNFGSYKEYGDLTNRFYNRSLAGGAMLDIGVYALSVMRLFMASQPAEVVSLGNTCETGVDVAGGIVCRNAEQQLGVVSLTLHSKQPKRSVISFDKCYIEVNEYPRADHATIVWTVDGRREEVHAGTEAYALCYEMADLEKAVAGDDSKRELLGYASDVMELMTKLRADWGVVYPEEE